MTRRRRRPSWPRAGDALRARSPTARAAAPTTRALVTVPLRPGTRLIEVVRALDAAGVDAQDVHRREATLDDVFLALTDRPTPSPQPEAVRMTRPAALAALALSDCWSPAATSPTSARSRRS